MNQPYPNLYLDKKHVRAKSISWIELHYPCGGTGQILPKDPVRGILLKGKRPIGFTWHNPKAIKVTPKLIKWIDTEFQHIFTHDAFKWKASLHTAPKELQCHLIGPTNN